MGEIKNTPSIIDKPIINVNRNQIEHRATWMGLSYKAAWKSGADGENILRVAVAQTGCLHGEKIRQKLSESIELDKFADAFLDSVGIETFEMEFMKKTADELEIHFHYCPLVTAWLRAGIPEEDIPTLCDIAMDGDRNIASTVGVEFELSDTIAAGDEVCKLRFYRY
ncbi:MAG: L-2-amino-thiazoline-4-carboxylic acid hydrolase [Dehalococcoidales bacterium]|nr:MAG: L-2-amino-thiazoline-4-carboxylic acid hydrolase [Dehalococcoidales bacterium]